MSCYVEAKEMREGEKKDKKKEGLAMKNRTVYYFRFTSILFLIFHNNITTDKNDDK